MADFKLEAEDLISVTGYRTENNAVASGGSLLGLRGNGGGEVGSATFAFSGDAGIYDIIVGTFDESDGAARFELTQGGSQLGSILLDQNPGGTGVSADTQVERTIASGIAIADGDSFTLTGFENGQEHARFDFIRFVQVGTVEPTLSLDIDADSISENGGTTTATLTRTGDLTNALTVTLGSSDGDAATVPSTVEILAGQASVQFQVTGVNDDDIDGTQTATISATAAGFTDASDVIDVTDDDGFSGAVIQVEAESIADTTRYRRRSNGIASGGELLSLRGGASSETGTATFAFDGAAGVYTIILGTFDENDGDARFELTQNGSELGSIVLDQNLGGSGVSLDTQVERILATDVAIATGDSFTLSGIEDGGEHARFDFIRFEQVGDVPESAPTFLTPSSVTVSENQTSVLDIEAQDINGDSEANGGLTYSLTGGADLALFNLNANTGVLSFQSPPDFENPGDSNADNTYELEITVTDSTGRTDVQSLNVAVENVNETDPSGGLPVFLPDNDGFVIEAEVVEPKGFWVKKTIDNREALLFDNPGSTFRTVRQDQQLEYRFKTDEGGSHFIALYGARDNTVMEDFARDKGNDVYVGVENVETGEVIQEGTKLSTYFGSSNLTYLWGTTFSADEERVPTRVDLEANTEYRLLVTGRSDGYAFDRITIGKGKFYRDANAPQSEFETSGEPTDPGPTPDPDLPPAPGSIILEAEDAVISGNYRAESNDAASGDRLLGLTGGSNTEQGSATFGFNDTPGTYDVILGVFDERDGISNFVVTLNDVETGTTTELGTLQLDDDLGSGLANGQTAVTRTVATGIGLTAGDTITVTGTEDNKEPARLDFLQLSPSGF